MKVKTISYVDPNQLDREINQFLDTVIDKILVSKPEVVDIKYSTTSIDNLVLHSAMIIYN